jgi:desulfoferrodoxin (superoxide reductase-like protein)
MARPIRVVLFLLVSLLAVLSSPKAAIANVPDVVLSANPIVDCGAPLAGRGFLLLVTVTHANPSVSHYIDKIEVEKERITDTISLQPQSSEVFTVTTVICEDRDYRSGQELAVQARAHCNIHGWGGWSSSLTVPEFGTPSLIGFVALLLVWSTTFSLKRSRTSGARTTHPFYAWHENHKWKMRTYPTELTSL